MKRIKELIDTVGKKPVGNSSGGEDIDRNSIKFIHHMHVANPIIDQELIQHIDSDFFKADTDPKLKELKVLPGDVAIETIEAKRNVLCNQLAAVTKKLSDVILENQPSYAKELKRVQELQQSLHNAFVICSNGRRLLNSAKEENSQLNLGLLSNYKKERQLCMLLEALRTIKTLQNTDLRLREMLQEEEYDDAVQLCLECKQVASTYRQYNCIKDLTTKLQDTLEQMEEQIDVALSRTCQSFDATMYRKLQASYKLLGKSQAAADQLLMHYTTCIHNTAYGIVLEFSQNQDNSSASNANNTTKNNQGNHEHKTGNFRNICAMVKREQYIPCLLEICKCLWKVMLAYHQTIQWHHQTNEAKNKVDGDDETQEVEGYVMKRLTQGRHRVWADVQSRVKTYFVSAAKNLNTTFKYDDFIIILDLLKRFIKTGQEFCNYTTDDVVVPPSPSLSGADQLKDALHSQTLNYFHAHHRAASEELVMFIENESWQPIPVKSNFSVFDMQEFKFLQRYDNNQFDTQIEKQETTEVTTTTNDETCCYLQQDYQQTTTTKTPFDDFMENATKSAKNKNTDDIYDNDLSNGDDGSDISTDEDEEKLDDYIEADDQVISQSKSATSISSTTSMKSNQPIITNSALHVLRLCGNYMKMGDTLKPISVDVVVSMCQLFEVYFYSVLTCFSTEERRKRCQNERLESTVKRIKQTLFTAARTSSDSQERIDTSLHQPTPHLHIGLDDENSLFAIQQRVVALQSLSWLADQFCSLQNYLEAMMNETSIKKLQPVLKHFYSQTISLCDDVRWVVTYEVTSRLHFFKQCTLQMQKSVNWDVSEIMTQHNQYVDQLLHELARFKQLLYRSIDLFPLPDVMEKCIWKQCIVLSNHSFVDGFASVKVCSNEGRALMQLDYQQFLNKLEKITNIRPTPNRELVESYIKAFYLIDTDLEKWISQHKSEYTSTQLTSLLQQCSSFVSTPAISSQQASSSGSSSAVENVAVSAAATTKQKVMSLIEEIAAAGRK